MNLMGCRPAFRLVGVSRYFDNPVAPVRAVDDVTLDVHYGEMLCLVGPSGCGKSTLLSLMAGITTPTSGSIAFGDTTLSEVSQDERAKIRLEMIGMVFQDNRLIPEFSALENVALPLQLVGVSKTIVDEEALAALAKVGVADLSARFPDEMSGGQLQRVGIARAVVGSRKVVLADEATGALDSENSAIVFAVLKALAGAGHAVVAATHDPRALDYADRVVSMMDGRISEAQSSLAET